MLPRASGQNLERGRPDEFHRCVYYRRHQHGDPLDRRRSPNLTLNSGNTLDLPGSLQVFGTSLDNACTINVQNGALQVAGSSLSQTGGGTINMSSGAFFNQSSGSQTLINVNNSINGTGQLGQNGIALDNQASGTVNANVNGGTLSMNGGGLITGILTIDNNVTNTNGNITANGGTVNLTNSATITGGTLNTKNGGTKNAGTATLSGLTISTGSTVNDSGTTILAGTITNNGSIRVPNTNLTISGNVTLQGGGAVQMSSDAFFNQNSGGQTLHNVDNLIEGTGQLGQNGMALDNQASGTVNANVNRGTLSMNGGGTVTNAGLLAATNGGTLAVSNPVSSSTFSGGVLNGNYLVDGSVHPSTLQINALGTAGGEVTSIGNGTVSSSITLMGLDANTRFVDQNATTRWRSTQ